MREQWLPSPIWSLFHAIPNSHSCRRTLEPHFLHDTCAIDRFSTLYPLVSSLQLRVDFVQHIHSLDLSTIRSTQSIAWTLRKLGSLYCMEIFLIS